MRSATAMLPLGKVIAGSLVLSWERRRALLRVLWLPLLLGIGLTIAESFLGPASVRQGGSENATPSQTSLLLWSLPLFALTIVFAVRCYRVFLLGEQSPAASAPISWGLRETRFVFAMAGVAFVFLMAAFVFGSAVALVVPKVKKFADGPFGLALLLPPGYMAGRLLLALPAIAVDHCDDVLQALAGSWKMTRRNGWRVLALCVLLPGVLAWSLEAISRLSIPGIYLVSGIAVWLAMPVELALVALSYLTLRPNGDGIVPDADRAE